MFQIWWPAGFAALCAAVLMPLAIRSRSLGHDRDFTGVQKVHEVSTSRLGGLSVFFAYCAVLSVAERMGHAALSPALPRCAVPVVLVGAWEDITRRVHPWHRLFGAVAAGAPRELVRDRHHCPLGPADPRSLAPSRSRCRSHGSWWPAHAMRSI